MKFANLERLGYTNGKNELNVGDYIQLQAIDNLYQQMGVAQDVVYLDAWDMATYKGEKLMLPVNQFLAGEPWFDKDYNFMFSEDIDPIFLGLSLKESAFEFTNKNIAFLKRYAPIGCRDYYTFQRLSKFEIPAYIAGCLSMTLPERNGDKCVFNKIFLVDVPSEVKRNIPTNLLAKSEIVHHVFEISEENFQDRCYAKRTTKELFERYQKEAALVVTYRLHCASPCLAMGIPVVVVRPYRAYPCDWLEQFSHIYTEEDYTDISWDVKPICLKEYKEIAKRVAINRLEGTCTQEDIDKLHDYHLRGYSNDYSPASMTINHFISELEKRFQRDEHFDYAMWGISDVAEKIYEYLLCNYPNAKLVKVIDSYSDKVFHEIASEKPDVLSKNDSFVTIVATINCMLSGAKPLFSALGKNESQYIYAADPYLEDI